MGSFTFGTDVARGSVCPKGEARTHRTPCDISPKGEARTHGTACDIGPKGEARTFKLRASLAYLTPSNGYIGFPYHPLVRPKRHGTACDIGPKGEARTHGTACAIGPKGEARTFELRTSSGYLTPSNGYIGFPY